MTFSAYNSENPLIDQWSLDGKKPAVQNNVHHVICSVKSACMPALGLTPLPYEAEYICKVAEPIQ